MTGWTAPGRSGERPRIARGRAALALTIAAGALAAFLASGLVPPSGAAAPAAAAASLEGVATYYARSFDGRLTASGTRFDSDAMVAAHPTLPFGTTVRVTNVANGRAVTVRIVDRGPAARARNRGVIIDLSRAAAESLGFIRAGRAKVRVDVLDR